MLKKNDKDIYFTSRIGVVLLLVLLIVVACGQIKRTEPRQIISPVPIVEAQEITEVLPAPTPSEKQPKTIPEMIIKYSEKYKVDPLLVSCILFNESSYNPNATGDSGKAKGIAQYHLATFKNFRRLMGKSQEDLRLNPEASIETLCWALSTNRGYHWSVFEGCLR